VRFDAHQPAVPAEELHKRELAVVMLLPFLFFFDPESLVKLFLAVVEFLLG
jgi:hypothetical protein